MIYTFYSYNGGVGRSNSVAGVAEHFYQQGLRVLVLDWDVESPGVQSFFPEQVGHPPIEGSEADAASHDVDRAKARPGLFDMLAEYRRTFAAMPAAAEETTATPGPSEPREAPTSSTENAFELPAAAEERTPALAHYLSPVHSSDAADHGGSLHVLPAGSPSQDKAAADFDWDAFYNSFRGKEYFDRLRTQLLKAADVVLVDSPSGVTALGGVCAHLADVVVCFRAKNDENAEIIESMLEHFRSEEFLAARHGRSLETIVIRGDGEANGASTEANGDGSETNGASTEASEPPETASSSLAFRLALLAPENHPIRWLVASPSPEASSVPSTEAAVPSTEAADPSTEAALQVPQPTEQVEDAGSVATSSLLTTHEVFDEIRRELEATPEPPASSDPFGALSSAWSSVEASSVETASVEKASGETLLGERSAGSQQDESKAPILEAPPLGAFSETPIAAEAPIATDAAPLSDVAAKSLAGDTAVAPAGAGERDEAKPEQGRDEVEPDHGADEPRLKEQRAATERRLREKSSALPTTELAPRPSVLESSPPVVRSRPAAPRQSAARGWPAALRRPAVWGWPAAVLSVAALGIVFDLATRGHGDAHPASSPTREVAVSPTADKGPSTPNASAPAAVIPPTAEDKATGKPTDVGAGKPAAAGAQRDEPSGSSGLYLRVGFGRSCTRIVNYRNQFLAAGMSNARAVQLKSRKCALVLGPYPADIVERRRAEHNARHIRGFDNATVVDDGDFEEWL